MSRKHAADPYDEAPATEPEILAPTTLGTIVVMERTYTVNLPYHEGHVLTASEASVLNQTYKENLRNNFVGSVRRAIERNEPPPTQEDFEAYAKDYTFGSRRGKLQIKLDPVGTEERKLCDLRIRQALKDKGIKFASVDKDKFHSLVQGLVESGKFRAKAEEIVRQRQATEDFSLDLESLS